MGSHNIPYSLEAHADTHENGAADEIDVAALDGVLADAQVPIVHHTLHEEGNADALADAIAIAAMADLASTKIWQGSVGNRPVEVAMPAGGALSSKVTTETRVMNVASGDVPYTGVGFIPTVIIAFAAVYATTISSWGFSDSDKAVGCIGRFGSDATEPGYYTSLIGLASSAGHGQNAIVKTYDADGFTLTWTKVGTPPGSTATLKFLCLK